MRTYHDPEEYFLMWLRQQKRDDREIKQRIADLRAFDRLPETVRACIREAPFEVVAGSVLACINEHGSDSTAAALRSLIERWLAAAE